MQTEQTVVIVGGGLTGATAATTVRDGGFAGRLVLVAGENEVPYIRPPLSKEFLLGKAPRESTLVHPAQWYRDNGVDLIQGHNATVLSTADKRLTLDNGDVLAYDRLLLATGASARRYSSPAADLTGVHHLRTVGQSESLKQALAGGGRRVVIVGSGWIGLEVASAARQYGNSVTVIGRDPVPLGAILGDQMGAVFADLHRQNGVDLRTSAAVDAIEGDTKAVSGVRLDTGELLPADVVVVGIGAVPNIDLAKSAGLTIDNGILVDAGFRTSDPFVYAAGDVANVFHPVLDEHIRIEHWANALNAGAAVGRALLGEAVSYDEIPYFYTDQFDLGMEYSGYGSLTPGADVVIRGNLAAREFIAFWVKEARVVAGMNVNVWDVNETVQQFIRTGISVDSQRLADEAVPLQSLLPDPAA
jgi:3-phenylpropionate/trans-cinnamate dioxygenase ferredoxin reductase component